MNILQRALAPTPAFFKKLRLFGCILSTISGILMAYETSQVIQALAGHIATAGAMLMAVSQLTVDEMNLPINVARDEK